MSRSRQDREAFGRSLVEPDASAPEQILPNHQARFDVHRNNVSHARIETLRSIFPVVQQLVGQEFFTALARAFIEHAPPTSPLLFRYGGDFADFVSGFPPASSVPYLCDIARIEWLRLQAYHAEDADPLGLVALAEVPPDELPALQLGLHPSLGIVRSRWPVFSIWANSLDPNEEYLVDMDDAQSVLVLRVDLQVQTMPMSDAAARFLNELVHGARLGAAAETTHASVPGFDLGEQLAALFQNNAVVSLGRDPS